jgi:hypothetical protein
MPIFMTYTMSFFLALRGPPSNNSIAHSDLVNPRQIPYVVGLCLPQPALHSIPGTWLLVKSITCAAVLLRMMEPYHLQCLTQVREIYERFFWEQNISPALSALETLCSNIRAHLREVKRHVARLDTPQTREEVVLIISELSGGLSTALREVKKGLQSRTESHSRMRPVTDSCGDLNVVLRFQSFILENLAAVTSTLVDLIVLDLQ